MKRVILNILIIIFAFLIIGSIFAFINGSLETFPNAEQIEKARIAAIGVGVISTFVEVLLIRLRFKK